MNYKDEMECIWSSKFQLSNSRSVFCCCCLQFSSRDSMYLRRRLWWNQCSSLEDVNLVVNGNASWSLNKVLPFLSFFGYHTGFWSRCPGVKFIMSSRHGRERNGPGLWAGKHPRNCWCVCRYDVMVPFGSLPYHRRGGLRIWWLSGDLQVCVV